MSEEQMMSRSSELVIGLLWHSVNSDNLGVGALTASNIAIVEKLSEALGLRPRFLVIGWRDAGAAYISSDNVEVVDIRMRDLVRPSKLHAAVRRCDLVIDISAGDSFADIYGAKRIGSNLLGKLAVLLSKKPLLFGPQTIGPFNNRLAKSAAEFFIKRSDLVVSRDSLSSDYVAHLNLGEKFIEATDVAIRLPYDPASYSRNERVRIGLNVSGLLFNGGYTQNNMFNLKADYPTVVRRIIRELLEDESQPEIHLIGHVNAREMPVEDDHRICDALASEFPDTKLAPRFESPSDAKSYISSMDFFAGARMHACIAAFSSGVPVVPMAYSRKFEGLFGTLGYERTTDCRSETEEKIVAAVLSGYRNRKLLHEEVKQTLAIADRKLGIYEARIASFLEHVREKRQ